MRTKFIEGTNKQYSIREDGIITIHYKMQRVTNDRMNKILCNRKLNILRGNVFNINYNGNRKQVALNTLLFNAFGFRICKDCGKNKKNVSITYSLCKKCSSERRRINNIRLAAKFRKNNPDKIKEMNNNRIKNLIPCYVASKLKISISIVPQYLLNTKKQQLLLHREIKQQLKT